MVKLEFLITKKRIQLVKTVNLSPLIGVLAKFSHKVLFSGLYIQKTGVHEFVSARRVIWRIIGGNSKFFSRSSF